MDLLSKMLSFRRESLPASYLSSLTATNLVSKLTQMKADLKLRERLESVFDDLISFNRQSGMASAR